MSRTSRVELATSAQNNFLLILFNDCGFGTAQQRLGFCEKRGIYVNALPEITKSQARELIKELIDLRDRQRPRPVREEDSDDY